MRAQDIRTGNIIRLSTRTNARAHWPFNFIVLDVTNATPNLGLAFRMLDMQTFITMKFYSLYMESTWNIERLAP